MCCGRGVRCQSVGLLSDMMASAKISPVPVESPLRSRTAAAAAASALQGRALAAGPRVAGIGEPAIGRPQEIPGNWATADLPGVPWRVRDVRLDEATNAPTPSAPTRTARLNALLGRA